MKHKSIPIALAVFQILILAGMLFKAMLPLLTGTEIQLEVTPRDPRELFRGNYVALNYDFNTLQLDSIPNDISPEAQYSYGDELYIELKKSGAVYRAAGLWQAQPESTTPYLKAIVERNYYPGYPYIQLSCGIESYFTDPDKARAIEERLINQLPDDGHRDPITVSVMVAANGESRLKEIHIHDGEQ